MAATFAEWQKWPNREVIIAVHIEPSLSLGENWVVWTNDGTYTNSYTTPLAAIAYASHVAGSRTYTYPGGMYRKVVGVRENGTDLTERASAALVDANAGSWYWDPAAGTLWVRPTSAASPATFDAYQAFVRYHFATRPITIDQTAGNSDTGIYHHPWLTSDMPRLSSYTEDYFFGIKIGETGTLTFNNTADVWTPMVFDHIWKNKKVKFYLGGAYNGQMLPWSEWQYIHTTRIEDVVCDENAATFQLRPLSRLADIELPPTPIFDDDYPNLGDSVRGTRKRIGYGRATIFPALVDTSTSYGVWLLADASYQTLFAVNNVWAINRQTGVHTLLTVTTHYTVDLTACTVTIVHATYKYQDYNIWVDVTGKPDGLGSYLKTFGTIVPDMLKTFAGAVDADIDSTAFAACDTVNNAELSVWIDKERSLNSILSTSEPGLPSLERSVLATVLQTTDGKWTAFAWEPVMDASGDIEMDRDDFAVFTPDPVLSNLFHEVRVFFDYRPADDSWSAKKTTNNKTKWLAEQPNPLDIFTYLTADADAVEIANMYSQLAVVTPLEIEFVERGCKLAAAKAGDRIQLTFAPLPVAGGSAEGATYEIMRVDRQLGQDGVLTISGRLSNVRGIAGSIGRWMLDTAPDYTAASAAERQQSGFWTDDAGLADPPNASSAGFSFWW